MVKDTPDSPTVAAKSLLKSRAKKSGWDRKRAPGGGRQCQAIQVRQELYEWWTSIRYAVDWKEVIKENKSRGLKKNLARFPRSLVKIKLEMSTSLTAVAAKQQTDYGVDIPDRSCGKKSDAVCCERAWRRVC